MIYWLSLIFGGLITLYLIYSHSKSNHEYLNKVSVALTDEDRQAVKLGVLSDESFSKKISRFFQRTYRHIDSHATVKIVAYCLFLVVVGVYFNQTFIQGNPLIVIVLAEILGISFGVAWLSNREKSRFEESFPDALNMLSSAVSSGESIMHGIIFVGNSLEGKVGQEFKRMGEQLQLGETADTVFRKSCARFPYPSFQFFVITLRTSMQRGGQLKEVMTRLNRLMFGARAIEKKKYALTSEARASAKIVAAIPFIFLFMLQYLSPENYEFVMFNPDGKPILYYVLISESIGIFIIWLLMKGVRS